MKLSEEIIYNKFEKYINCGIDCNELESLRDWVIKKEEALEKQVEKLKQEKTDILNALKTVNEIRDKLRAEKKELKDYIESKIESLYDEDSYCFIFNEKEKENIIETNKTTLLNILNKIKEKNDMTEKLKEQTVIENMEELIIEDINKPITMKIGTMPLYAYEIKGLTKDNNVLKKGQKIEFISYFSNEKWQTGIISYFKNGIPFVERF